MTERVALAGGLRVVAEPMPGALSAAFGVWVDVGSRDEEPELSGASHVLEHVLFKGTATRTAREISEAIEGVGGDLNAFTTKECTAFHVRVPARDADVALEILLDVCTAPRLDPDDFDAERAVILEELALRDDTPDDLVHDLLGEAVFDGHPLGRDVLGSRETLVAMSRDDVARFFERHYGASTAVVAAAGAVDVDHVVASSEACFAERGVRGGRSARVRPPDHHPATIVAHRSMEQVHAAIGTRAVAADDDDRFPLAILNQIFGGGVASRLFDEIRERRGLAYSVYSYIGLHDGDGIIAVYLGTAPGRVDDAMKVVGEQIDLLLAEGVTDRELTVAKGFVEGSATLALETPNARMHRIGQSELIFGEVPSVEEQLARYRAVTRDDVMRVAERVLGQPWSVAAVGPVAEDVAAGWVREVT